MVRIVWSNFSLLIILALGAGLRLWGIGFGLPYMYEFDEGNLLYSTFYAASHWLRPNIYTHSTLIAYLMLPLYGLYFLIGRVLGIFANGFDFYVAYLFNPTVFVLLGRLLMTLISLGCVVLTYLTGRRFFSYKVGLLSAVFVAFSFLMVKESHYIKDEVLATFFLLAFFSFVLRALERRGRDLWLAGIFLGLAVSAKYIYFPAGLVLPAAVFAAKKDKKMLLFAVFLAVVSFLLTNPYILLDWRVFFGQMWRMFLERRTLGSGVVGGGPEWLSYLRTELADGLGWFVYLSSWLGFVICLWGSEGRKGRFLVLMTFSLFLGLIVAGGVYPRWALPLIPFLSLLAGLALKRIPLRRVVLALLVVVMIFPNLLRIVKFDRLLTLPDTRTLAKSWVEEHIAAGTSIAVEGTARDEIPSYLGPPLVLEQGRLEETLAQVQAGGQGGLSLKAKLRAYRERIGYDLVGVPRIDARYDPERGSYLPLSSAQYYLDRGVSYVIRSSWVREENPAMDESFLESFAKDYEIVASFQPSVRFGDDPHAWKVDYQALDRSQVWAVGSFGPEIRIYRLKNLSNQ